MATWIVERNLSCGSYHPQLWLHEQHLKKWQFKCDTKAGKALEDFHTFFLNFDLQIVVDTMSLNTPPGPHHKK